MSEITKEYIKMKISEIKPYEKNNKKHTIKDVSEVIKSIQKNTDIAPMIIDENNTLIAGHGRLLAFKKLKYKEIQVLKISGLTEEQKKDYRIRDNTTSLFAEFDFDNIISEVLSLGDDAMDMVGHLEGLEIFQGLNFFQSEEFIEEIQDKVPELPEKEKIKVKTGDIFKLGNHYLMCGSSTSSSDVEKLMNGSKADCVLTDPPYLMDFQGAMNGKGEKNMKHKKIENDDLKGAEGQKFLEDFLFQVKKHYFINNFQVSSILENNRTRKNDLHPTMKPIELLEKILNNSTKTGDKVLDLFGGSGSTLIACEKKQRVCYMMELTPEYCQTIIKRFFQVTNGSKEIKCLNRKIDFNFLN